MVGTRIGVGLTRMQVPKDGNDTKPVLIPNFMVYQKRGEKEKRKKNGKGRKKGERGKKKKKGGGKVDSAGKNGKDLPEQGEK